MVPGMASRRRAVASEPPSHLAMSPAPTSVSGGTKGTTAGGGAGAGAACEAAGPGTGPGATGPWPRPQPNTLAANSSETARAAWGRPAHLTTHQQPCGHASISWNREIAPTRLAIFDAQSSRSLVASGSYSQELRTRTTGCRLRASGSRLTAYDSWLKEIFVVLSCLRGPYFFASYCKHIEHVRVLHDERAVHGTEAVDGLGVVVHDVEPGRGRLLPVEADVRGPAARSDRCIERAPGRSRAC